MLAAGLLHRSGRPPEAQRLLDGIGHGGDDSALVVAGAARRAQAARRRGVASPTDGMAEAYTALAGALRGQGSGDFVLVLAQLALRLRPGFAPALMLTADVLPEEKQEEQALAVLSRVSADDPLAPLAALRRAAVLDKLDRPDEAVAVLRRLADANPDLPQPAAHLGDLLRRRNRFAEAAVAYDQALSRVARSGVRDWPLFYSRAIARERAGDWPRAEADLLRALELSPDQPYVLNYLGYTWADQGRNLDRAKAMLLRATELRPQDGNIADSLGWVLFRLGDTRGAVHLAGKGGGAGAALLRHQRPPRRRLLGRRAAAGGAVPVAPRPQPRAGAGGRAEDRGQAARRPGRRPRPAPRSVDAVRRRGGRRRSRRPRRSTCSCTSPGGGRTATTSWTAWRFSARRRTRWKRRRHRR